MSAQQTAEHRITDGDRGTNNEDPFRLMRDRVPVASVIDGAEVGKQIRCISPDHEDNNPSMHVYEDHVYCFSCKLNADVVKAWGILKGIDQQIDAARDLAGAFNIVLPGEVRPSTNGSAHKDKEREEQTYTTEYVYSRPVYEFRNLAGEVLYVQRHKGAYYLRVSEDRWISGRGVLDGVARVPYNLPELIEGVRAKKTVYHLEGCKDADTATERLGVPATTTGGVNTWRSEFHTYYVGADVAILPDNDAEGIDYARRVAGDVAGVARSVKVVRLPGLPEKGDLTDFMEAGGTPEQVIQAVEDAPYYRADEDANTANTANTANEFEDLRDLPEPDAFPVWVLPPSVAQLVREAAKAIGCPVDFLAASALVCMSAAIGNTRRILIKNGWTEGAALWVMIVGGPASKKSPALFEATRPVLEMQLAMKAEYERQKEEYEAALANWDKDADPDGKPRKPVLKRTYVDDITVEKLADTLNENPRGVGLIKDELSGWLRSMDQYKQGGKGGDRQKWLQIHTNRPIAVDRKSSEEPVIVPRPYVPIVGGIQPEVLPDFGKDRGDGLMDRYLPAYPEPQLGRWTDDEISDGAREAYADTIKTLYGLEHAEHDGDSFSSKVEMSKEAKAVFVAEYNRLHEELEAPGFPQRLRPVYGKLEASLARFALILAMGRCAEATNVVGRHAVEKVLREDMEGAAQLLAYFKNHARRVYTGLYGTNAADNLAADLRDFLVSCGGQWEGSASELFEAFESEHKPDRDKDLGKEVRAIAKRFPLLRLEDLPRKTTLRRFRLILENVGSVGSVGSDAAPAEEFAADDNGLPNGRRLTPDETERVKRFISQGMKPEIARAKVLGADG